MFAFVNFVPASPSPSFLGADAHSQHCALRRLSRRQPSIFAPSRSQLTACLQSPSPASVPSSPSPSGSASANGWESEREDLARLQSTIVPNPSSAPDEGDTDAVALPGVHFAQPPRITTDDLLRLVRQEVPDEWVNEIMRSLLGWFQTGDGTWDSSAVPAVWRDDYPDGPPDFIGSVDDYSPQRDRPVKKAVQKLTRSISEPYKQISREVLAPLGFSGWTIRELTPNRTRRATVANFVLFWFRVHYPDYEF